MATYKVVYKTAGGATLSKFVAGRYNATVAATVIRRCGGTVIAVRPVVSA